MSQVGWARASAGVTCWNSVGRSAAERAAAGGQNHLRHLLPPTGGEGLEEGGVLAVDGHDLRPGPPGRGHHQRAGDHQRLLIRQGHSLAGLHGGERAVQAGGADDGAQHRVRVRVGGDLLQRLHAEPQFAAGGEGGAVDCRSRPTSSASTAMLHRRACGTAPPVPANERFAARARGIEFRPGGEHVAGARADRPRRTEDHHARDIGHRDGIAVGAGKTAGHGRAVPATPSTAAGR